MPRMERRNFMKLTSGGAAGMLVSSGTIAQDSQSKNKKGA